MKLSWFGRLALALFASLALGLGMTACGGGTVAYLWVLGQQYNEIAAFKVDAYTGNLTQVPRQPFASHGSVPVMLVVKPGGRFVYVLNQGSGGGPGKNGAGAEIDEFTVGGDGTLSFQLSYPIQGFVPMWLQIDNTGNYLIELDKYSPAYQPDPTKPAYDVNGSISVYAIDGTTGRLSLQTNANSNPGAPNLTYWEVGVSPLMMQVAGTCLFTVDSADQSIYPYSLATNGQLTPETTGLFFPGASNITSINGNGTYVILTDAGTNKVLPYTVSGNCSLASLAGGAKSLGGISSVPSNSFITRNSKYLYVLNQSTTNTDPNNPYSSISGFILSSTDGLTQLTDSPFPVDNGPVCMVEDPTNHYMYISAHNAGSVTGKIYDDRTGDLSALTRGSTFSATGQAACLALSGAVD